MANETEVDGDGNIVIPGASNSTINVTVQKNDGGKKSQSVPKYITIQSLTPPNYFTGREEVLETLAKILKAHRTASLCGISGLGKTSVAYKYAEIYAENYQHIIFIRVDRLGFEANFEKTCELMFLDFEAEDIEISKTIKFQAKINELCGALKPDKFLLLIFDNVDQVERLQKYLTAHPGLHLLFTSNFNKIYRLGEKVEISNLSEDEAMLLLYRNAKLTHTESLEQLSIAEKDIIREIVRLFGFHPLAIFVAGNYISENNKTFAKYLERLKVAQGKFLKDEKGVDAYQYRDIYSAFEIAYDSICDTVGKSEEEIMAISIALECLKIASVLAPSNMPEEVFRETAALINPEWQEYLSDNDNWDKIYQKLSMYGLFERDGEANTFSIHRLVKLFLADKLKDQQQTVAEPIAQTFDARFDYYDFTNRGEVERLLPHVGSFLNYLEESGKQIAPVVNKTGVPVSPNQIKLSLENEEIIVLCYRFAWYYHQNAQYNTAEKYFLCSKDICERTENIEPSLLATSYHNLANLYRVQNKFEDSELLYKKALEIRIGVLDENDPDIAENYDNLAKLYMDQNKWIEGEQYLRKALKIREDTLGENHPDTATSYCDLGGFYESQQNYGEAEKYFKKAIKVYEEVLGANHPWTATSYMNLGAFYYEQYMDDEALEYCNKALKIYQNSLPADHPNIKSCEGWIELINNAVPIDQVADHQDIQDV